ncbi:MAG: prepilin peptidase [Acidimicrobiales bacterium]
MTTPDPHLFAAIVSVPIGLVVGSFAGVVADRAPRGESVVRPPSHCVACGVLVRPADNIPVFSYLLLRGRCRSCKARIPPRDLVIEIVTAGLFVLLAFRLPTPYALPAYLVLAAGLVALSAVDLELRRLPTPIVYWTGGVAGALLVFASGMTGHWNNLLQALIGGAACFAVFFAIFFISPRGMGFGDVRLAGLCGTFLGWTAIVAIPIGIFAGFVLAGLPAIALLVAGKATRKTQVPFGPFLAAGTIVGICFGQVVGHALGHL